MAAGEMAPAQALVEQLAGQGRQVLNRLLNGQQVRKKLRTKLEPSKRENVEYFWPRPDRPGRADRSYQAFCQGNPPAAGQAPGQLDPAGCLCLRG